ncbi:MAG: NAD(P)H-dependent flavin oxidoreductase [bacterium]
MKTPNLKKFWRKGIDFLGVEHAIIGGAMAWISESSLVSAISSNGGFGVLASGNMPAEMFAGEIEKTRKKTDRPFGVNLITLSPNFDELLSVVLDLKAEFIIFAGGIPPAHAIKQAKSAGSKVICFAPARVLAKKMIKQGADALIVEGTEAGGHIGPVSTSVLAQEVLLNVDEIPVFVAGGIGTGEMMAQYLAMGAAGCQLGTKFVVAEESIAHINFKNKFIKSAARDAQPTAQFDSSLPVVPVRALINKATVEFNHLQMELLKAVKSGEIDRKSASLKLEEFWLGSLRKAAIDGDVEYGSVMAGQSVGMVKQIEPTTDIIGDLVSRAEFTLNRLTNS